MTFAIFVDIVVVVWLLYRQRKVRRVWPRVNLRLAVVLAVIGLVELLDYTAQHHLSPAVAGVLALSFAVGAVTLGAVRAATVNIWRVEGAVLRQGTWLTVGLWILSLALHYGAEGWIDSLHGPGGVITASLMLWLGVTYGVQNAVVHHRAEGVIQAGGPIDARSETVGGRWWAGTWVRSTGGPGGPGGPVRRGGPGGPVGRSGLSRSHPDAIEARAEPIEPPLPPPPPSSPSPSPPSPPSSPPAPGGPAGGHGGSPGAKRRPADPGS
jgi:hypothetical protein